MALATAPSWSLAGLIHAPGKVIFLIVSSRRWGQQRGRVALIIIILNIRSGGLSLSSVLVLAVTVATQHTHNCPAAPGLLELPRCLHHLCTLCTWTWGP